MNGRLITAIVFATGLAFTEQACNPNACILKLPGTGVDVNNVCRIVNEYIDCQKNVIADCGLDASILNPFKKQLEGIGCNSAGMQSFSITCLLLCGILNKMMN